MKYIIPAVLISCATALMTAQHTRETKFKQRESVNKGITKHNLIFKYNRARSELSCATECSNNELCSVFLPNINRYFCSLHSQEEIQPEQTTDTNGPTTFKPGKDFTNIGYTFSAKAGIWYKGYTFWLNWTSAVKRCEQDGAALISATSREKRILVNTIKTSSRMFHLWIGCWKKTGEWVWMDGTAVNRTSWANAPPPAKGCCGQNNDLKLYSNPCSFQWPFVCEISP